MNSPVLVIFSAFAVFCEYALAQPVKYDQRQEGDLNVRTDVEDVVFVVVPPQDLVTAGMGLVAASAADFFRKNYGSIGPERWPMRTSPKLGFVPLEKSPYKIDLEKSGIKVKKIAHAGDPNRYNFHEGKNPTKNSQDAKGVSPTEVPEKSTVEMVTEMIEEMQSTTESKTVKKVLKPEETKKVIVAEEKKPVEEKKETKVSADPEKKDTKISAVPVIKDTKIIADPVIKETKVSADPEKKDTKMSAGPVIKETKVSADPEKIIADLVKRAEETKTKTETKMAEEPPKVIGEGTKDGLDPTSIFRLEGCGPDAYRDNTGKCIYKKV